MTTNYLPGWGLGLWGYSSWGSLVTDEGTPQIISRYPEINQTEVTEDTAITVQIFDVNYDLDITSIALLINGVLAYDGISGFAPGFTGKFTYISGVSTLLVTSFSGFEYNQLVTIHLNAQDAASHILDSTWSFTVRDNPTCYAGNQPLPIEVALQSPMETYLNLEPFRVLMLNTALRPGPKAITSAGNKAARVIYQLAYSTELSTVLNSFDEKNARAITSKVCERQTTLEIDRALHTRKKELPPAVLAFKARGLVPDPYLRAFNDYLDSALYTYRVSLVANMLILARYLEINNG